MPHIDLQNDFPGIRGPMGFRPEISAPLNQLAEVLLRSDNTMTRGERELIATYVLALNDCFFCQQVHGSLAQHYLECSTDFIDAVKADFISSGITDKMKALLNIPGKVQVLGKEVTQDDIDAARSEGADDREVHDTVLIAAAFSMFNHYVDGLASFTPTDPATYEEMGKRMAKDIRCHRGNNYFMRIKKWF